MRQNITQQLKLSVAPAPQFPWRCCGSVWWSQRTPSLQRRWGRRMTISHGRDGAADLPSTWRQLLAGPTSGSPPAWSETTRGWDSASQGAKAPHPTVLETRWEWEQNDNTIWLNIETDSLISRLTVDWSVKESIFLSKNTKYFQVPAVETLGYNAFLCWYAVDWISLFCRLLKQTKWIPCLRLQKNMIGFFFFFLLIN